MTGCPALKTYYVPRTLIVFFSPNPSNNLYEAFSYFSNWMCFLWLLTGTTNGLTFNTNLLSLLEAIKMWVEPHFSFLFLKNLI